MLGHWASFVLLVQLATADKAPVDAQRLAALTRYAAFSSAAYSPNCTIPPYGSVVQQYIDNNATSTQLYLFRDDAAKEFILSFRGTSDAQDFVADNDQTLVPCVAPGISCSNCTCFEGYLINYNSVAADVKSALDSAMAAHSCYSLTITGHSLGGGLASLASASLKGQGYNFVTYSYGQPRTGDPNYADYIDSLFGGQNGTFYRATHENDGVPQIPPTTAGYRHHSTEYWQSADPPATDNTYQCQGQEPADCNQSEPGYGIGDGGIGINVAHLTYFGISTGNPLDPDAACLGTV